MNKTETFAMIKPSCTKFIADVEKEMMLSGLAVVESAKVRLSEEQAAQFYAEHQGKPFFTELVSMLSSSPVMVYHLSGTDAVKRWRDLIGPTNPNKGERDQLRRRFADGEAYEQGSPDNGFHGSANNEDAEREINLMKEWGIFVK